MDKPIRARDARKTHELGEGDFVYYNFADLGHLKIAEVARDEHGLFLQTVPAVAIGKKAPDA